MNFIKKYTINIAMVAASCLAFLYLLKVVALFTAALLSLGIPGVYLILAFLVLVVALILTLGSHNESD